MTESRETHVSFCGLQFIQCVQIKKAVYLTKMPKIEKYFCTILCHKTYVHKCICNIAISICNLLQTEHAFKKMRYIVPTKFVVHINHSKLRPRSATL